MEAMELQANIQIIPWNNNNGDTYNNNNYSYNNNDLNLHNNNNNNINFIGEEEPMEIDEDENTTELSNAIHKGDPFHYAKLHLHREIGNRDHKINELLLKLDDCRQQMQFVHNGGSLWQLQVMLAQQADVINAKVFWISHFSWTLFLYSVTYPCTNTTSFERPLYDVVPTLCGRRNNIACVQG